MPELPEVETVKNILNNKVKGLIIKDVKLHYPKIVEYPTSDVFIKKIVNQKIKEIKRHGKWLLFELDDYYLLSHLRMEGKKLFMFAEETNHSDYEKIIGTYSGLHRFIDNICPENERI